jgi:PilZ domain-containing protein
MVDGSESTTRNESFLRRHEHQRLNKSCNRIIDLRGKVAGECQAYTFGGLTHYLDDRAYLLAKQLLDRFNGRYTVGVNEALFKALKTLTNESTGTNTRQKAKPILIRDQADVQFIAFDQLLLRKEPRIQFATALDLHVADVLYHATTIDITSSAIRITLKRAFTLEEGDSVSVSFPEFITNLQPKLLAKIHYTLFKVEHDQRRTYAILVRDHDDNKDVTAWFDHWTQSHNTLEYLDFDNELSNLASHYYLRLYSTNLNSPLFWLNDNQEDDSIKAFNLTPAAEIALNSLRMADNNIDFSLLPIQQTSEQQHDYLIIIHQQDGQPQSIVIARDKPQLIASALTWFSQQKHCHILLMQTHSIHIYPEDFDKEIIHLAETDESYAQALTERLTTISRLVTLSDITSSCQHLAHTQTPDSPKLLTMTNKNVLSEKIPRPTPLRHYIERESQRFFIKTAVTLKLNGEIFSVITTDVSETGLSLNLPGRVDIHEGTTVKINFLRWQKQTNKVKLTAVPFFIKSVQFWDGSTFIGLERNLPACAKSVNTFFVTAIERDKDQLIEDVSDVPLSQETRIFSSLLGQQFTSIPFFLGVDEGNTRILQAITTSQNNHAKELSDLWLAMQDLVALMSEVLADSPDNSAQFGLYCYLDSSGNWRLSSDLTFTTIAQKSLFINQALACKSYYFFHCSLTPINSSVIDQENDLNSQLSLLRSHSPHKVKQIRETLYSLFAVGELTDITDIISTAYH